MKHARICQALCGEKKTATDYLLLCEEISRPGEGSLRVAYIFLETILSYQALKWLRHLLPSFCLRLLPSTFCLRHMGTIFCLRQLAPIFCLRHLLPLFCLSYNELSSSGKGPRSGPLRMTLKTWDFIAD